MEHLRAPVPVCVAAPTPLSAKCLPGCPACRACVTGRHCSAGLGAATRAWAVFEAVAAAVPSACGILPRLSASAPNLPRVIRPLTTSYLTSEVTFPRQCCSEMSGVGSPKRRQRNLLTRGCLVLCGPGPEWGMGYSVRGRLGQHWGRVWWQFRAGGHS